MANVVAALVLYPILVGALTSASSKDGLGFTRKRANETSVAQRVAVVVAGERLEVARDFSGALVFSNMEEFLAAHSYEPVDEYFDDITDGVPRGMARKKMRKGMPFGDGGMYDLPQMTVSALYSACTALTQPCASPADLWRPAHPHATRTWRDYDASECRELLRFRQEDMQRLFNALDFPADGFRTKSKYHFTDEEGFTLLLRRLASTQTLETIKKEFNRYPPALSEGFNAVANWFENKWGHLIDGSRPNGDLRRWAPEVESWAAAIRNKTGEFDEAHFGDIVAFIDGTFQSMARPGPTAYFADLQRLFYSG